MPVNITTAVDSLVELINNKKRISLEAAAKELGLPENIINEWATFLEEEKVLEIEYQFTTPFLITKTKEEVNEEDYSRNVEIILRNLEIFLAQLTKIEIKHAINIKNINDLKQVLVKKGSLDNDVLYAQKFVLEYQIKELISKINKLKKIKEGDYESINADYENIKKRKLLFNKNYDKLI
jgi:hypothetical protein